MSRIVWPVGTNLGKGFGIHAWRLTIAHQTMLDVPSQSGVDGSPSLAAVVLCGDTVYNLCVPLWFRSVLVCIVHGHGGSALLFQGLIGTCGLDTTSKAPDAVHCVYPTREV